MDEEKKIEAIVKEDIVFRDMLAAKKSVTNITATEEKISVLLVEDDKFLRELLVRKLISDGFDVRNAGDGKSALLVLAEFKPKIILLDLILPEADGFVILAQIKRDPTLSNIPVIILSNLGQKEDLEKATAMGAKDFMIKSNFTLDEISAKARLIANGGKN